MLLTLAAFAPAAAQQMRGVLRDSAVGVPLPGGVVSLLDSSGASTARTITDVDGRFVITVPAAAKQVRVIRIGYRPRTVALPADRSALLQLSMERLPPMLAAVRVTEQELCPGGSERGGAFDLWEQVRAGLLATIVARESKPAQARTLVYENRLSPTVERVRRQTKSVRTGQTTRPFLAGASPSFFARFGYMIEDRTGRLFNAPDADILLDESFAATHCFRLRSADRDHPGQVGLAFAPVGGRDTLVDVQGVIWVDAPRPQLRSVDFSYTSLEPAATQARAGGHLEFRTMENGVSFIARWNLRLPNLQVLVSTVNDPSRRQVNPIPPPRTERLDLHVAEVIEAGGVVLEAQWADGARWEDPPSSVSGIVVHKGDGSPAVGAVVTLSGTPDTVLADQSGAFRLATLPGKYELIASDTTLMEYVAPRTASATVTISPAADTERRVELGPLVDVIRDVCRSQPAPPNSAILVGVVAPTGRRLPENAHVRATWQSYDRAADGGIRVSDHSAEVGMDDRGRFVVCGVAHDRNVALRLLDGSRAMGDTVVTVSPAGATHAVRWVPGPPRQ